MSLPTTSGLETEWDYSGRKERDGQKKKIVKATEKKRKVKRAKDEKVNGQRGKGVSRPHAGTKSLLATDCSYGSNSGIIHDCMIRYYIRPMLRNVSYTK